MNKHLVFRILRVLFAGAILAAVLILSLGAWQIAHAQTVIVETPSSVTICIQVSPGMWSCQ